MNTYDKSLKVMTELFSKDLPFYLATAKDEIPSLRVVDTYYDNEAFWIVTYRQSNKVIEIECNPNVSLCSNLYSFKGKAYNAGHPLIDENKAIREKLIEVFKDWYFLHNNEKDEGMCYVKFIPEKGFFYKDGTGYKANFASREVDAFPFVSHIEGLD